MAPKERIVKVEVSLEDNILGRNRIEVYEFPWEGHTKTYEAIIRKHWSRFAGSDWELMGMKILYITPMYLIEEQESLLCESCLCRDCQCD